MTDMVVRAAGADDLAAILGLWRDSMALHAAQDPSYRPAPTGPRHFRRFATAQMASDQARVLVAARGPRVLGYGICVLRRRPLYFLPLEHGLITDLDIAAAARGQGLGERILDGLLAWLRARGIGRVEVEVVTANEGSRRFWRKHGFAQHHEALHRAP
ncbi:GNAT family N-acetyltransferase [Paracraurococcus ruber]|nr:GNAT family N-acetyltransferase [Paracraurococcus ruber]